MFEYIKLRNFKSFSDMTINFCDRQGNPKKIVVIYGENGAGKTNIASALYFLSESVKTMDFRDLMQTMLAEKPELNEDFMISFFKTQFRDLETLIRDYKLVSSEDPMYLEFGFNIDGHRGIYVIETNNSQLLHERLEFVISKNKGVYFDIGAEKVQINNKVFLNKNTYNDVVQACEKFWGKHSLLSIISHEINDKSENYICNGISKLFLDLISYINTITCKINLGNKFESFEHNYLPNEVLGNYANGVIPEANKDMLVRAERMLSAFFSSISDDIRRLYYKIDKCDDGISYKLMEIKYIAGKEREIPFSLESTGNRSLLKLLPCMLLSSLGLVTIIDEFELGLHEKLVKELVAALYKSIRGQLILTSHNTNLMDADSELPRDSFYVITENENGMKEIIPVTSCGNRLNKNSSIKNQYASGKFKGVPNIKELDFRQLLGQIGL